MTTQQTLSLLDAHQIVKAILADSDLTPVQRLVTAAVVHQADSTTGIAWAGYRQLHAKLGVSMGLIAATLRADTGAAIGRWLLRDCIGRNGAVGYRVIVPGASLSESDNYENTPRRSIQQSASAIEARSTDCVDALQPQERSASVSDTILTLYSTSYSTPPYPPQAGGGGGEASPQEEPETIEATIHRIGQAYAATIGQSLPGKWKRRIRRAWKQGDRAQLAQFDGAAIRSGLQMAKTAGRTFGWGWVERAIEQRAVMRAERAERVDQVRQRARQDDDRAHREAEAAAEQARRLDAFRSLAEANREAWLQQARRKYPFARRADLLERLAAKLAEEGVA